MAEGLLNAFWRGLLSQTANATTETSTNENEVCRRLILSGITVSAAGVITIPGLTIGTILVAGGGTGQVTLPTHGVLVGQGTSPVASVAVGTTGQVLTGVTGADPTFQNPAALSAQTNQGTTTTVLHGNAAGAVSFATVTEADLTLADVTTRDVSTTAHGFAPKAPNDATKYLDGTGLYSLPSGLDVLQIEALL